MDEEISNLCDKSFCQIIERKIVFFLSDFLMVSNALEFLSSMATQDISNIRLSLIVLRLMDS